MEYTDKKTLEYLSECQIPCLPRISEGKARYDPQPWPLPLKRMLARPWNYYVKKTLKRVYFKWTAFFGAVRPPSESSRTTSMDLTREDLKPGEWVRVRSREEIEATLNPWKEMKGCAVLADMWQYCGTNQKVLKSMRRFLDERDYQVKKCRGIVLLEGVICQGTPVFGQCDRCCHFFWREEWLEKVKIAS
jgi:hypothetical protein